ncbi:ABC transporter ATP-binding protein [Spirochaeta lutea]|uniref:ABC transporter ATP-binding protein n=1 Tax=Spirochaeta lutea TaxID=1480694 RepID=UPI00068AF635|nr:ATP-binding cassette domain-containing protein [Spirochaeta lutea]
MISVSQLSKSYGSVTAVDRVDFDLRPGEILGLLGPNGAGKTTIMKVLTGYHYQSSGSVTLDGVPISENPLECKARIGYLPENAPVYTELTVHEYLEFIAETRLAAESRVQAIETAARRCGILDVLWRPIQELSKGYRQRVALAQAIMHDPDVLILDEPTTGLDPNQIQEIRTLIRELGKNKSIILSTHILQEVEALCDRVIILNRGRVAASGTPQAIARELKGDWVFALRIRHPEGIGGITPAIKAVSGLVGSRIEDQEQGTVESPQEWINLQVVLPASMTSDEAGLQLFQWAASHGIELSALKPVTAGLEDLFKQLTTQDPHDNPGNDTPRKEDLNV